MKKLILLLFLSLFIFPIGLKANTDLSEKLTSLTKVTCDYYVTVLKIVDGDTFIGLTIDSRKVFPPSGNRFTRKRSTVFREIEKET